MKNIAKILIFILLFTTVIVAPMKSDAAGEFVTSPRTVNYDPVTAGGTLTFEFEIDAAFADYYLHWAVTPEAETLTPEQVQTRLKDTVSYPGGNIVLIESLQQVTVAPIAAGQAYKLHYVIASGGSLISESLSTLSFEAMSFINSTPMLNANGIGDLSVDVNANTGGVVYGAVYADGVPSSKEEIINVGGDAFAYAQQVINSPGELVTLNFTSNVLQLGVDYAVHLVRQDDYGNYFYSGTPALSGLQLTSVGLTSATYDNHLLTSLIDDQLSITFDAPLTNPGNENDYFIRLGTGQGVSFDPVAFSFDPVADYIFQNYDAATYTVNLNITEAGLLKLKAYINDATYVLQIRPAEVNNLRPRILYSETVDIAPFDLTVINQADQGNQGNQAGFVVPPRTMNYHSEGAGGTLTFELQVNPEYIDNDVYWVITPENVTLTDQEIMTQALGTNYPGDVLEDTTTLQQVTADSIVKEQKYKLHYVVYNAGNPIGASLGSLTFDAVSYSLYPVMSINGSGYVTVAFRLRTAGMAYGALYLDGVPPTKEDIIDVGGTALAYGQIEVVPEQTMTLNFTDSQWSSDKNYVVYMVSQDAYGNQFYDAIPILPWVYLIHAEYNNGLLRHLADDQIDLSFYGRLTHAGNVEDYVIQVGSGQGEAFVSDDFSFMPGTDYVLKNFNLMTNTVSLGITEVGLQKLKAHPLSTSSVMQIRTTEVNAIRPRSGHSVPIDIFPFDLTVFDQADPSVFDLPPRTANYRPDRSGGTLTFESMLKPIYADKEVFFVVTPETITLTAEAVQEEAEGTTYPGLVVGNLQSNQRNGSISSIAPGQRYKLHYVVADRDNNLPVSLGSLTFDAMSFINPTPIFNTSGGGNFSVSMRLSTPGTVYGALYLTGIAPNKEEIIDDYFTALAKDHQTVTTPGELMTFSFTDSGWSSDKLYAVYLVRQDSLGNYFYNYMPIQLPTISFVSAVYDNGDLFELTDDHIRVTFNGSPYEPVYSEDYDIQVGSGQGEAFVPDDFSFIPGTDYIVYTYDPISYTVRINITEVGLQKLKEHQLSPSSVMQIRPAEGNSTISRQVPYSDRIDIFPFDLSLINQADGVGLPRFVSANYDTLATPSPNDDGILLAFDLQNITNGGGSGDYQIEMDTHSTTGFLSADVTLTTSDYTVTTQNGGVRLNLTEAGVAKLPASGLSFWKISILNCTHLTPNVYADGSIAIFSRTAPAQGIAQLTQALLGGLPIVGFSPDIYEYTIGIPYSYVAQLGGDYSSLLTGVGSMGQTIYAVHETLGVEKIIATAPEMENRIYIFNTVVNHMSLSSINIGGQPIAGFNKFVNAFSAPDVEGVTVPPTLTAIADHPSAVVSVTGSGGLPGWYYYSITVTYQGQSKTYTIALHSSAIQTPPVVVPVVPPVVSPIAPPVVAPVNGGGGGDSSGPPATNTTVPITTPVTPPTPPQVLSNPPTPPAVDNTQQLNQTIQSFVQTPTSGEVATQLTKVNELLVTSGNASQTQLLGVLNQMDTVLQSVGNSVPATGGTLTEAVSQQVVQLTETVEKKLLQIGNAEDAMKVTTDYLKGLSDLSQKTSLTDPSLNKSVEDILSGITKKLGTIELEVPKDPTQAIDVKVDSIKKAIEQQAKFAQTVKTLNDLFFGDSDTRKLTTSIVIAVETSTATETTQTKFKPETLLLLKEAKISELSVDVGGSVLTIPSELMRTQSEYVFATKLNIQQEGSSTIESGTPVKPSRIVEFTFFENGKSLETFAKPVELTFKLSDFGLTGADGGFTGIYKLNEVTGLWKAVGGVVDPESGIIVVKRGTLSQYTVMKSKKSFSDSDTSWAKNEIDSLLNKGVVESTSKFEPKALLTRGEFASWIAKAYGLSASSKAVPFKDLKKTDKNYEAVSAVYQLGIINGKSKDKFDPNGNITADEMAVIIGKTLVMFNDKQASAKVKSKHLDTLKSKSVASWAEGDQALLMELGLSGANAFAKGNELVSKETAAATFSKFYKS